MIKIIITTVITIIAVVILKILEKNKKPEVRNFESVEEVPSLNDVQNKGTLTLGNNNTSVYHVTNNLLSSLEGQVTDEKNDIENRKKTTSILFIDDDTKLSIVKILKNEGWENTKLINDLKSYSDVKLINSHIVFVDIQGVGKLLECKEEGLGLALHIKNQYPDKKVIIFSAIQSHKVFHDAIRKVDFLLSKDAEPIQFISLVEKFSQEI